MPRRALSTLRAEIRDGGPLGTSMELSGSASSALVSIDVSLELLMQNLRGFNASATELENEAPFLGVEVGSGKPLRAM